MYYEKVKYFYNYSVCIILLFVSDESPSDHERQRAVRDRGEQVRRSGGQRITLFPPKFYHSFKNTFIIPSKILSNCVCSFSKNVKTL